MKDLPPAGPGVPPQTVEVDAGPLWGKFRMVFSVKKHPNRKLGRWFWVPDSSERIAPPTQRYQYYLAADVLTEAGQCHAWRILLKPEDARTFLDVGGRDLHLHPRALEILKEHAEFVDVHEVKFLPVAVK